MKIQKLQLFELNENLEIFSGYSFRNKIEHSSHGDAAIVQLKDVDYNSLSINTDLTCVDSSSIKEKYTLVPQDVLFISKGSNNLALMAPKNNKRCIASSVFFVLRCSQDWLLPEYLAWYLNQPMAQNHFASNTEGTYTQNISKLSLLDLEIAFPTLDNQQKIVQAANLLQHEQNILAQIKEKRQTQISYQLNQLIKH